MTALATEPLPIPYVRQPEVRQQRMCGAAALAMVFRYWAGERAECSQPHRDALDCHVIWSRIAADDGRGGRYARCHRLTADLCHAGLDAATIQAAEPWQALQATMEAGLPTIVNFRLGPQSPLGHFAVLTALAPDAVCLHDPQHGPNRWLPREQFIELWESTTPGGETVGRAMIVVACPPRQSEPPVRWPEQSCPGCRRAFPFPPVRPLLSAIVGAFCPWCDRGWRLQLADE